MIDENKKLEIELPKPSSTIPTTKYSNLKKPTKLNIKITTTTNKIIEQKPTKTSSITSLNSTKEDSGYSSLTNSTINSQEITKTSPKTNKNNLIMNSIVKNNYFKPIITPPKTQLKSFEIVELNENNENASSTTITTNKRNTTMDNSSEYIKLDVQTYKNLIEDFHSTKLLLYKLSSIVKDFEEKTNLLVDSSSQTD